MFLLQGLVWKVPHTHARDEGEGCVDLHSVLYRHTISQYNNVTPPLCLSSTVGTSDILFSVGDVQIKCGPPPIVCRMWSGRGCSE